MRGRRGNRFWRFGGDGLAGLGHLLAGNIKWAAVWFSMWIGIIAAGACILLDPQSLPGLLVLVPLAVVVQFSQLLHAGRCGRLSLHWMLGDSSSRYLTGVMLAAIGLAECYEFTSSAGELG